MFAGACNTNCNLLVSNIMVIRACVPQANPELNRFCYVTYLIQRYSVLYICVLPRSTYQRTSLGEPSQMQRICAQMYVTSFLKSFLLAQYL
jgi:hypothetical protein